MTISQGFSQPVSSKPLAQIKDDAVPAWVGLYQAERSDLTALYLATIGVLAFAASVLAVSFGVVTTVPNLDPTVTLFLPIPLAAVILYNSVLASLTRRRAVSAQRLETAILQKVGTPIDQRDILILAGESRINPSSASFVSKVAVVASNSAIALVGLGFTVYCFFLAVGHAHLAWLLAFPLASVILLGSAIALHVKHF